MRIDRCPFITSRVEQVGRSGPPVPGGRKVPTRCLLTPEHDGDHLVRGADGDTHKVAEVPA